MSVSVLQPQEGRTYVGREDASTEQDISESNQYKQTQLHNVLTRGVFSLIF